MKRRFLLPVVAACAVVIGVSASSAEAGLLGGLFGGDPCCCEPACCDPCCEPACCDPCCDPCCKPRLIDRLRDAKRPYPRERRASPGRPASGQAIASSSPQIAGTTQRPSRAKGVGSVSGRGRGLSITPTALRSSRSRTRP